MDKSNTATLTSAPSEWEIFLESLSSEKRVEVEKIQKLQDFVVWCEENGIENPHLQWLNRYDFLLSQDERPENNQNEKVTSKEHGSRQRQRRLQYRDPTYEEFQEGARKEAEKAASEWEKNPDLSHAPNKEEVYYASLRKTNDDFVKTNETLAEKWAKERNDAFLELALERKRREDEEKKKKAQQESAYQTQRKGHADEGLGNNFPQTPQATPQSKTQLTGTRYTRGRLSGISSLPARFARRSIIRPAGVTARRLGSSVIGKGISFTGRAISIASKIMALIGLISFGFAGIFFAAIAIGAVVVVFIIVLVIIIWQSFFPSPKESPYPGIIYSIIGPERIENGELIKNQILLTYKIGAVCLLEDVTLVDTLPPRSEYISATGDKPIANGGKVSWKLTENSPSSEGAEGKKYIFEVVHKPPNGSVATSSASIEGCSEQPGTPGIDYTLKLFEGQDATPSAKGCPYKDYDRSMTAIQRDFTIKETNFGDPICNFGESNLLDVIKLVETKEHVDQGYADFWMDIAECESNFTPTDYGRTGQIADSNQDGTWGLFQMRRSYPKPLKPWDPNKKDRGDVTWQRQVQNAIDYNNNVRNGDFTYWGTAMRLCWYPSYAKEPYCKKIVDAKTKKQIPPDTPPVNDCTTRKGVEKDFRL